MRKSHSLIFFGNERLSSGFEPHGAPILQTLLDHGYNVKAVVANYEKARSRQARELEIGSVAERYHIPVLLPDKPNLIAAQLKEYQAEIGVLVAYGRIIPQHIIDIFPYGIVNVHPSLLPEFRGPTPIEEAILRGKRKTGVSIMKLTRTMDAGPIYAQRAIRLEGSETKQELTDRLLASGTELVVEVLASIFNNTAHLTDQDDAQATCTPLIRKEDGLLDLTKSAAQLEREIRAYAGWPKSRIEVDGHSIIVTRAHVAQTRQDALSLACHPGFLHIDELVAPSGKTMTARQFIHGYLR